MPYHLELGSSGHNFPVGKGIVVNTQTGQHFSDHPIPVERARKQMRLLEGLEHGSIKPKRSKK